MPSALSQSPEKATDILSSNRLPSVDALRGAAALIVFQFHYFGLVEPRIFGIGIWEGLQKLVTFSGSLGTNILLLLSGYFIAVSLGSPRFEYLKFLGRKTERLYRPYMFVLGCTLVFWAFVPGAAKDHPGQSDFQYIFQNLILIPEIFPGRPALTVTWTLSYIYAGYCLIPLLGLIKKRILAPAPLHWLWALCIVVIFACNAFFGKPVARAAYIPAGCMLATLTRDRACLVVRKTVFAGLLACVMGLLAIRFVLFENPTLLSPNASLRQIVFVSLGISSMLLLTLLVISAEQKWRFESIPIRFLRFVGRRGYSVYLWHGPVTKIIVGSTAVLTSGVVEERLGFVFVMLVCLCATLIVANVSYRFFETVPKS